MPRIFRADFFAQHLRITRNHGKRGIHFMGYPGCKQADGREFLVLNELVFQADPVGDVVDDDQRSARGARLCPQVMWRRN